MTPVKIIFAGLIVLSLEEGIPNRNSLRIETLDEAVSAYLLSDANHVPVLIIPRDNVDESTPGTQCAEVNEAGYVPGDCRDEDKDHFIWSLTGLDLELVGSSSSARYLNGSRQAGGGKRYFKHGQLKEISPPSTLHSYDVTWIPEMKKVIGIDRLSRNFEAGVTSALTGLQGEMVPILWNEQRWYWFEVSNGNYVEPTGKQYDQVFAHKVEMGLDLTSMELELKRREGSTSEEVTIKLVEDIDRSTHIHVYNLPKKGSLEKKTVNGEEVCIATHFQHFYDVLETEPTKPRVPYIRSGACELKQTYLVGIESHGLTTDSFCPPVIVVKPGG